MTNSQSYYTSTESPFMIMRNYAEQLGGEGVLKSGVLNYPLDVEGFAQAFARRHQYSYQSSLFYFAAVPAFSFDPKADTWREWRLGVGWKERRSVLHEMTSSIGAVCAFQAYFHSPDRTTMDESDEDEKLCVLRSTTS